MTESIQESSPRRGRDAVAVDVVDHLETDWEDSIEGRSRRPGDEQSAEELRQALDHCHLRLLTALDAVAGAEAEAGTATSRIRELELEQHMLEVERDELRREVERLAVQHRRGLRRILRLARSLMRRMAP